MPNANLPRNPLVAAAFVALAACASAGANSAAGTPDSVDGALAVHVINDLLPPAVVTIWMVPASGGRRRLGLISPSGEETFNTNPTLRSMEYRLIAQVSGDEDRMSNPFVLQDISGVEWRISSAGIRITR